MSPSDQIVRSEMFQIQELVARGIGRYEAVKAVDAVPTGGRSKPPTGQAPAAASPDTR